MGEIKGQHKHRVEPRKTPLRRGFAVNRCHQRVVSGGRLGKQVLTGLGRQVLAGAPGFEETHEGEGGAGLARGANRSGPFTSSAADHRRSVARLACPDGLGPCFRSGSKAPGQAVGHHPAAIQLLDAANRPGRILIAVVDLRRWCSRIVQRGLRAEAVGAIGVAGVAVGHRRVGLVMHQPCREIPDLLPQLVRSTRLFALLPTAIGL